MINDEIFQWKTNSEIRKGRNVSEGYARGWGIQFSDLREKVKLDPLYQEAVELSSGRTIMTEDNRINIYLIMKYCLRDIPLGNIVEFGSYKGGQAIFMSYVAKKLLPTVKVYAFDTFKGMPLTDVKVDAHSFGDFNDVDLPELKSYIEKNNLDNLELVEGLFESTLPTKITQMGPISLAHIDCDIYSACVYAYESIKKNMVNGGYYIFDDATVSSCLGATEAVEEYLVMRDKLHSEQIFPHYVFRHGLM